MTPGRGMFSKNVRSLNIMVLERQCFEGIFIKDESVGRLVSQLLNQKSSTGSVF